MIIYGTGSKYLTTRQMVTEKCPSCNNSTLLMHVFQKYFDIFWIPVFPYSKIVTVECSHCKTVFEKEDAPETFQREVSEVKQSTTTPLYLFVGLFLIFLDIGYGIYSSEQEDKNTKVYLSQPQVNDYYVLDIENLEDPAYKYIVCKITGFKADSILFNLGQFVYNRSYHAKDAINDGEVSEINYFGDTLISSRNDLDSNKIVAIFRFSETN